MSTIYRTYEVLIEETLSANDPKRQKSAKPSRENTATRRALETTHQIFQDAVCYYILCLIGLVRDATEAAADGTEIEINPLWHTLTTGAQGTRTDELVRALCKRYPHAPWRESHGLLPFYGAVYDWKRLGLNTVSAQLTSTYKLLFSQAVGENTDDMAASALEDLKSFAGTWIAILCNENGDTTIPGGGVYDTVHRQLKANPHDDANLLANVVGASFDQALKERLVDLEERKETTVQRLTLENLQARKKKSPERIMASAETALAMKIRKECLTLREAYVRALSPDKTRKYCSLSAVQIQEALALVRAKPLTVESFPRFRFGARDNSFEQPLFRYNLLKDIAGCRDAVVHDVWEYVRNEQPEAALLDSAGHFLQVLPYQTTGREPLFPYFTNCLGISVANRAAWFDFDKSAFKRAAEEVFKYRIRSDKRRSEYDAKAARVLAMEGTGEWRNANGLPKQLSGMRDDPRREKMEQLLAEIGGSLGYGLRRGTIGGWGDLREDFLKTSKDGEPDGEELEKLVGAAQTASGGGFGSAAFFKKLCEPDYFALWQENWEPKQTWHATNFVAWYVRYAEAKAELKVLIEEDADTAGHTEPSASPTTAQRLKPISITLPGTNNRHGEESFRPLDFVCKIEPHPHLDLFDRDEAGQYRLVRTNTTLVKGKHKDSGPDGADYPLTLSYRRLKRDRIVGKDGLSMEAFYQPPVVLDGAPDFHQETREKALKANKTYAPSALAVSASLLPPNRVSGPYHLTMAMPVEADGLASATPKIDNKKHPNPAKRSENSVRFGPPLNGEYTRMYFRWPVDAETEKRRSADGTVEDDAGSGKSAKISASKLWCAKDFDPFHILSVDLGVRYAGAWCRAKVFKGEPASGQRVVSSESDEAITGKVVFGVEQVGTFRLQGEDVKLWRKGKGQERHSFEQEPFGSQGRKATDAEIAAFVQLAKEVVPESARNPLSTGDDLKFYPQLAGHLQFRLARRLGQLRMLFNIRWRVMGRMKKDGHVYRTLSGQELESFQLDQRMRVIEMLDFKPRDDVTDDREESHMEKLRLALADSSAWEGLQFTFKGKQVRLFARHRTKSGKAAQETEKQMLMRQLAQSPARWRWAALAEEVSRQIDEAMTTFAGNHGLVARIAHFVWPLIKKRWVWQPCAKDPNERQSVLECVADDAVAAQNITGMRGLSMRRIELLQEFRRCCQSLAKIERRYYRDDQGGLEPSPVRPDDVIHEPAPAWIDKINELRTQRVNQSAHLILAEALGLELMNPDEVTVDGLKKAALKTERDVHGRYASNPSKPRVAAIVLEDLSRYRTSQDRSRFENRQLMEWSHRQVLTKLIDMAWKVFGIPVFTVDARFSSRFSSRTGVPGIRCAEVSKGFAHEHPWKKWAEETVLVPKDKNGTRMPSERAILIRRTAARLVDAPSKITLLLPLDGGPSFLPVLPHHSGQEGLEANADINAAVNIGLRAVAHPDRFDVFPLLKGSPNPNDALEISAKRGRYANATQILTPALPGSGAAETLLETDNSTPEEEYAESGRIKYVFACPRIGNKPAFSIADKHRYQIAPHTSAAVSKIYWSRVKQESLARIESINEERLAKCQKTASANPDDIPMSLSSHSPPGQGPVRGFQESQA